VAFHWERQLTFVPANVCYRTFEDPTKDFTCADNERMRGFFQRARESGQSIRQMRAEALQRPAATMKEERGRRIARAAS
jgi:hypothetical protein